LADAEVEFFDDALTFFEDADKLLLLLIPALPEPLTLVFLISFLVLPAALAAVALTSAFLLVMVLFAEAYFAFAVALAEAYFEFKLALVEAYLLLA